MQVVCDVISTLFIKLKHDGTLVQKILAVLTIGNPVPILLGGPIFTETLEGAVHQEKALL